MGKHILQHVTGKITTGCMLFFFLHLPTATAATTTIVGIDLGMQHESLSISRDILNTAIQQANSTDNFGLVIADELVRTVIEPQPAADLLDTLSGLQLNQSDSGNFSALLERSLAMADESNVDATRLWIFSGGEISLNGGTDTAAKQARFQIWASDILLPDIATRYPDFRLITPQTNNPEIVEAVINSFGSAGQRVLPAAQSDIALFVDSLPTGGLTVAANLSLTDSPGSEPDATADAELIELSGNDAVNKDEYANESTQKEVGPAEAISNGNSTEPVTQEPVASRVADGEQIAQEHASESVSKEPATAELEAKEPGTAPDTDIEAALNVPEPADNQLNNESEPAATIVATAENSSPGIDSSGVDQIKIQPAVTSTASVGGETESALAATTNSDDAEVKESVLQVPVNKIDPAIILVTLVAISVLALIVTLFLRKKRRPVESPADAAGFSTMDTMVSEPMPARSNPSVSDEQTQVAKPGPPDTDSLPEKTAYVADKQLETVVVSKPVVSTDTATVVTQATEATEATAVNPTTRKADTESRSRQDSVEDDFSVFDRSIIEKRVAKLDDENPDLPDKK